MKNDSFVTAKLLLVNCPKIKKSGAPLGASAAGGGGGGGAAEVSGACGAAPGGGGGGGGGAAKEKPLTFYSSRKRIAKCGTFIFLQNNDPGHLDWTSSRK